MATNATHGFRGTDSGTTTTESKEDALSGIEYERLLRTTHDLGDDAEMARFAAIALGRLGLRRGELCHLDEQWIDRDRRMIQIPRHHDCTDGRDGNACGLCRQLAQQAADRHDGLTFEEAVGEYWLPKTEAGIREVYYGWDPRVRLAVSDFLDRYDGWVWSGMVINRRVNTMAEAAGLSTDRVRPHSLRSTAATHHAARGMDIWELMQYFGWELVSTALKYVNRNALRTARNMDQRRR